MEETAPLEAVAQMQSLLELFELGEEIMRQNLRRRFPAESEPEISRRFLAWRWRIAGYDSPQVPDLPGEVAVAL